MRRRLRAALPPERYADLAPAVGAAPAGSNGWVVDGTRTASGRPLVANDTAFALALPSPWYVCDLAWQGGRVAGFSLPGTPGVLIGRSKALAWGLVDAEADTQDLFTVDLAEEPHTTRQESIRVRGRRRPHVEEVRTTRQGPIVTALLEGETDALALAWTALAPAETAAGLRGLLLATDGDDLEAAAASLGGAALELVWGEAEGAVGSRLVGGPLPRRGQGGGLVPGDGADPEAGWQGTIPADEAPRRRDAPDGLLVAGENAPSDPERAASYRPRRIRELLGAGDLLSTADCLAAQADVRSLPGLRLQELLRGDAPAIDRPRAAWALLMAWDGELATDSAGGAVYGVLVRHLASEVFREALDALEDIDGVDLLAELSSGRAFAGRSTATLLDLLERRDDAFFRDDRTWAGVVAEALERTAAELGERVGPGSGGVALGRRPPPRARPPARPPAGPRPHLPPRPVPARRRRRHGPAGLAAPQRPRVGRAHGRPGDALRGRPRRPRRQPLRALRRPVGPPGVGRLRRPGRGLAGRPRAPAAVVGRGDRRRSRRDPLARPAALGAGPPGAAASPPGGRRRCAPSRRPTTSRSARRPSAPSGSA